MGHRLVMSSGMIASRKLRWPKWSCDAIVRLSTIGIMTDRPNLVFRTTGEVLLTGSMAIYDSQADASQHIPRQWRAFRLAHPTLGSGSKFYGASPCTSDGKIHYLAGVERGDGETAVGDASLILEAGEYAVVHVNDTTLLRDTWTWLLGSWLPTSGRREKHAPEFERFTSISEDGIPIGSVELWIPLEPLASY